MTCRTMLLGGAMALALSGAAFAQAQQTSPQATPGTDQINAGSATGAQTTTGNEATTSTGSMTKSSTHHGHHHYRHHMHHHMRTASLHHHNRMASSHHASTPAERQATQNLNQQQLNGTPAGYTAPQGGTQPGANQGNMTTQPGTYTQP